MTNDEKIQALIELGDKAYLEGQCQADNDAVCAYLCDELTQCDSTAAAIFNHIYFDRGQNRANADFFAQAANSREAIREMYGDLVEARCALTKYARENKRLKKHIEDKTEWKHAHEVMSYWEAKSNLLQKAFFAVIGNKPNNEAVRLCKNAVHESRWPEIIEEAEKLNAIKKENKRLRDALKLLIEYSEYQFMFGQSYHPTLASAINLARQALEGTE